ncbi:flavodoxin domain-containing protein [Candidatus Bathyarchaeota archaeon]|jgi:flavorubredoxin|nr:flavodoxin domain-containing protein [Candidatus Bathyarchaeota archaeon]
MARLLVFYHSRTGNTQKMADAVVEGARSIQGVEIELKTDMDVTPEDLAKFEAIAIGAPTYRHDMSIGIKNLLEEAASKKVATKGKLGACFGSYGWSGEAPKLVLHAMKENLEMNVIETPVQARNSPSPEDLEKCRDLGRTVSQKLTAQ